jgi:anti-sigma factor RsiW
MRYLGGHLGTAVSALVDGQLDAASAERAWVHVHGCETCSRQVEREGWVKTQLASIPGDEGPPPQLLGSLYSLGESTHPPDPAAAWAAVEELERRGRGRRRAGIALVGAGSVSAAVLGLASLTGSTLGIGGAPATAPSIAPTAVIAPVARVHGTLPLDRPAEGEGHDGLRR